MEPPVTQNKPYVQGLVSRQNTTSLHVRLTLADFEARNNVIDLELPTEAELQSGCIVVRDVSDDTGTDTISIGDSVSATRYLGATSVKSAARTAITPTGFLHGGANPSAVRLTRAAQNGDATKLEVTVSLTWTEVGKTDRTNG
jgi:hypothetical protein